MSIEPFNRLVKLVARAFYDDFTTKGDNQPKMGRSDNRGIAVVVLDTLTRKQWVREEDLAKELKLHSKQLRRILRFFEEEKLVTRDHRKETAKGAKIYSAAVAATADQQTTREGEEKIKLHTHSYCCLDYSQICDVVRYRLHRMKKKLKDELESKNTVQEYICPKCARRYTALDALRLVSLVDEFFHCESCDGELVAESDTLAKQEGGDGDGDDNARRRRREKLKDMLQKLEVQLKPLLEQLNRVKDLDAPEFGSLQSWESIARRNSKDDPISNDPFKYSQANGGTNMNFIGDPKVEVDFSHAIGKEEDVKSDAAGSGQKVLPPWMIKQGMNLTKEQRGEFNQDLKMDGSSAAQEFMDEKKPNSADDDNKKLQDEYVKAYMAAVLKRKQEQEEENAKLSHAPISNDISEQSSDRQVGMKSKREEDDVEDDVEWEEAPTAGNTSESYRVDLNMEAAEASGDDEDDIDWEEG
ncbi:Transcription factor TFIIE alpha subunit [Euphorbia peplus]|nr:Transcription factor TFIIE alpha subunit [Euphorbia peplus]